MADVSETINAAVRHRQAGRHAEAAESYRRLLQADPSRAEVYVNIGTVLKAQSRFREAAANFKQAIYLKPEFAAAYYNLANTLKEQRRYAEAIENYARAIGLRCRILQFGKHTANR
jgi:tetratricopeptide (TPR) repeat protein